MSLPDFLSSVLKYNIFWYKGKMISCMQPGGLFDLSCTNIYFRLFEAVVVITEALDLTI